MEKNTEFNEQEQVHIKGLVLKYLDRLEASQSVMDVVGVVVKLAQDLGKNPIQQIEEVFRTHESNIHLVAWPVVLSNNVKEGDVESLLPGLGEEKYPNFLYVTFGEREFEIAMIQLETDDQTNYENLRSTGIPYLKPGADLAGEVHYQDN